MKAILTANVAGAPKTHLIISSLDDDGAFNKNSLLLDQHVEDGEAEELIIDGVLEFVPIVDVMDTLTRWVKKLRHGGIIIINGYDAYLICKAFTEFNITIEQFNIMIHGNGKSVNLTCMGLSHFLSDAGLKIKQRRIDQFKYSIEAIRP